MQNRFGLKDLFIIVLIAFVGLLVLLNMVKSNREWDSLREIRQKIGALETQLATLDRGTRQQVGSIKDQVDTLGAKVDAVGEQIKQGVKVSAGAAAGTPPKGAGSSTASKPGARDESWALPGVPVEWQPAWSFATDPRTQNGFQEGGTFTEAFEARPAKLIPYIQTDVYGRRVVDIVSETLGAYDPHTLKLRGVLAEAWQIDPEGMWLRAKIRDEARFSDGMPVTAEDLRWTFHDFVMNPQIEAQRTRSTVADQIDQVKVISERVVEIRFKQKLFSNLDSALTLFVLPKHFYSSLTPAQINKGTGILMGSGPYKLRRLDIEDQWTPGQPIELVRNEQYWG